MVTLTPCERMDRMAVALAGLSVGDAFGERFFVEPAVVEQWVAERVTTHVRLPATGVAT